MSELNSMLFRFRCSFQVPSDCTFDIQYIKMDKRLNKGPNGALVCSSQFHQIQREHELLREDIKYVDIPIRKYFYGNNSLSETSKFVISFDCKTLLLFSYREKYLTRISRILESRLMTK